MSLSASSNFRAASEAVAHMIEQGFRRIAFVGTRMDPRTQQRMAGYRHIMEKHGLFDETLLITTPPKIECRDWSPHLLGSLTRGGPRL